MQRGFGWLAPGQTCPDCTTWYYIRKTLLAWTYIEPYDDWPFTSPWHEYCPNLSLSVFASFVYNYSLCPFFFFLFWVLVWSFTSVAATFSLCFKSSCLSRAITTPSCFFLFSNATPWRARRRCPFYKAKQEGKGRRRVARKLHFCGRLVLY